MPILVREESDPLKSVSTAPTGKYDPTRIFSGTSSLADKSFVASTGSRWDKNADLKTQDSFITKPYNFNEVAPAAASFDTAAQFPTSPFKGKANSDFTRVYPTATADADQNQTAALGKAGSPDQNRTALFKGQAIATYASPMTAQVFRGAEADAFITVSRGWTMARSGHDLPSRPLTVDEVRNLVNHGFKPNTHEKPGEPSKPLNDPDYQPQPLRDDPSPSVPASSKPRDDDKDDAVPPPGTMATPPPENSEALPQP